MPSRCLIVGTDLDEAVASAQHALAHELGLRLAFTGSGGWGTVALANVYTEQGGRIRLTAVRELGLGVVALLVNADDATDLERVEAVLAARLLVHSADGLRDRAAGSLADRPELLVALALAAGDAPGPGTVAVLRHASTHSDPAVRAAADYAITVAAEVAEPPVIFVARDAVPDVLRAPEASHDGSEVVRAAGGEAGGSRWVTVRPGSLGHSPRGPVAWLRLPDGTGPDDVDGVSMDLDWLIFAMGQDPDWYEDVWLTADRRTAVHVVNHPALGGAHLAVHGGDVSTVVAAAGEALGAVPVEGPPDGLASLSA